MSTMPIAGRLLRAGLLLGLALVADLARAEAPPLSRDELARCASRAQTLRSDSSRLLQQNASLSARRDDLNRRSALLREEAQRLPPDQLRAGLDHDQRQQQHEQERVAFNGEIAQFATEVDGVAAVRADYDRACANRAYRRADLTSLSVEAQAVMRAGLDDVVVPYITPLGH